MIDNIVTIKDIALATNFSANTVSRALRDMPDISEGTKQIIRDTAMRMGYRKNILASALRASHSYNIGVIVPDIQNPVYGSFYKGIETVCRQHNYTISLFNSNESIEDEERAVNTMISHQVDGAILFPTDKSQQNISVMQGSGIPFISLARYIKGENIRLVAGDDDRGGYIACEYLLGKGYTEFIVISGPHTISSFEDRCQGFARCLEEHGLNKHAARFIQIAPTWEEAYALTKNRLGSACRGKAIFALSDFMAMGAIKALRELELQVPRDAAIMGYDNVMDSNIVSPSLTTVDIRAAELGQISARRLLEIINNPQKRHEPIRELLEPQLIVRESV